MKVPFSKLKRSRIAESPPSSKYFPQYCRRVRPAGSASCPRRDEHGPDDVSIDCQTLPLPNRARPQADSCEYPENYETNPRRPGGIVFLALRKLRNEPKARLPSPNISNCPSSGGFFAALLRNGLPTTPSTWTSRKADRGTKIRWFWNVGSGGMMLKPRRLDQDQVIGQHSFHRIAVAEKKRTQMPGIFGRVRNVRCSRQVSPAIEIPNKTNGFCLRDRDPEQRSRRRRELRCYRPRIRRRPGRTPPQARGRSGPKAPFCWSIEPLNSPKCEDFLSNNFASIVSLAQCRRCRLKVLFVDTAKSFLDFCRVEKGLSANSLSAYLIDLQRFSDGDGSDRSRTARRRRISRAIWSPYTARGCRRGRLPAI